MILTCRSECEGSHAACSCPWCWPDVSPTCTLCNKLRKSKLNTQLLKVITSMEGYGHSMIRRAYFLMMLSSANMKSDLLTVRQFCRWGTGLYRAMVRARCALACFIEAVSCAAAASWPSPLPPRSKSPSPASAVSGADSSPNRAILQRDEETTRLR